MQPLSEQDAIGIQIDQAQCKKVGGLRVFTELAWPLVEPASPFQSNWHIDAICEHLEACFRGQISRLVINQPPGTGKSLLSSVFFPAYTWAVDPRTKWITSSYSDMIARRDSLRARMLMEHEWYRLRWDDWNPNPYSWTASLYRNDKGGFRLASTVGGGITGEHANLQLVDDPIKPLDASTSKVSTAEIEKVIEWWDHTMASRVVDVLNSARIIVMQRLHERDLSGHVLERGGYEHLMLPMRYEGPRKCHVAVTGWQDPREDDGELMWPDRIGEAAADKRAEELGPNAAAGQEQQRPTPSGGGIIKEEWVRHWDKLPAKFDAIRLSWDLNIGKKDVPKGAFVVGQAWGSFGGRHYLIDQVRGRWGHSQNKRQVVKLAELFPTYSEILIEEAADGAPVLDDLDGILPRMKPIKPVGSKEQRLDSTSSMWESGQVLIPPKDRFPWVEGYVHEITAFPSTAYADQVDTTSQYLNRARSKLAALERFKALGKR